MRRFGSKWFSLLFVGVTLAATSFSAEPTVYMEAYGDSLTAGFLCGSRLTDKQDLKSVSDIVSDMAMFLITQNTKYLTSHHRQDLAWPARYAKRLSDRGKRVALRNMAVSGARTWELTKQVQRASQLGKPSRAFFFIGHNDLCHSKQTPNQIAAQYVAQYTRAIREWDSKHQDSTAYFIPILRMDRIYSSLKDYVWYEGPRVKYSCTDSWEKLFPYCPSFSQLAKKGDLEKIIVPKIRAMNAALQKKAHDWEKDSKNNNAYKFLDVPETKNVGPDFFAVDCYHLSHVGQETVSVEIDKLAY